MSVNHGSTNSTNVGATQSVGRSIFETFLASSYAGVSAGVGGAGVGALAASGVLNKIDAFSLSSFGANSPHAALVGAGVAGAVGAAGSLVAVVAGVKPASVVTFVARSSSVFLCWGASAFVFASFCGGYEAAKATINGIQHAVSNGDVSAEICHGYNLGKSALNALMKAADISHHFASSACSEGKTSLADKDGQALSVIEAARQGLVIGGAMSVPLCAVMSDFKAAARKIAKASVRIPLVIGAVVAGVVALRTSDVSVGIGYGIEVGKIAFAGTFPIATGIALARASVPRLYNKYQNFALRR